MTTQLSNFLNNYSPVLLYCDLKRHCCKIFAAIDMTAVTSALLFVLKVKAAASTPMDALKVIGIRPMAPVLNTGPPEGI